MMGDYKTGQSETPWEMPNEVYWDKAPGATIRRVEWAIENQPEVPLTEVRRRMVVQPEDMLRAMGVLSILETDPANLPDAPTEDEMRKKFNDQEPSFEPLEGPFSESIQRGFLEIWRTEHLRDVLRSMPDSTFNFTLGLARESVERRTVHQSKGIEAQRLRIILNTGNSVAIQREHADKIKIDKERSNGK